MDFQLTLNAVLPTFSLTSSASFAGAFEISQNLALTAVSCHISSNMRIIKQQTATSSSDSNLVLDRNCADNVYAKLSLLPYPLF